MVTELCIQCTHSAHSYGLFRDQNGAAFVLLVFVEEFFWEGGTAVPNFKTTWHGSNVVRTCSAFFLVAANSVDAGTWIVPILSVVLPAMLGCVASTNLSLSGLLWWFFASFCSLQLYNIRLISYITYNYMVTKVQYKQWFHDDNWHCGPPEARQL